jgi:hypothetical protein
MDGAHAMHAWVGCGESAWIDTKGILCCEIYDILMECGHGVAAPK